MLQKEDSFFLDIIFRYIDSYCIEKVLLSFKIDIFKFFRFLTINSYEFLPKYLG